jgi:hypothetical protein
MNVAAAVIQAREPWMDGPYQTAEAVDRIRAAVHESLCTHLASGGITNVIRRSTNASNNR